MIDFTVAIRTYNGEKRLPAVLDRLRSQVGTESFSWEVVIVDNNSSDNTKKVVQAYQANWPQAYPLRYAFEAEQGAAFARQRAIREARGTFIGFLDDDNLPIPDWVAKAHAFGQQHPLAGAYGGQIRGNFEVAPPQHFERIAAFLAIIDRGQQVFRYDTKVLPPGAGLVVRKQAWLENVPSRLLLRGPVGSSLSAKSEDIEALAYLRKAGWEIWHNPAMCIYHEIPKSRLEKAYLLNLCRGAGLGRHHIRMIGFKPWQRPLVFPVYLANDLRKVIFHFIKYYRVLQTDVVAACEMELLLGILISPFFLWREKYLEAKAAGKYPDSLSTSV